MLFKHFFISLLLHFCASVAFATIFYIAPNGSDVPAAGLAKTSPWKTFAFAIPRLSPGDSLILVDGIYNASASGYPYIDCAANAKNGNENQIITLKAENERKAIIKDGGSVNPFLMLNCSYWLIEGISFEGGDFPGATTSEVVAIKDSHHITLKRLLVQKDNRYQNSSLIFLRVNNSLIEENELYSYHRYGMQLGSGNNNYFRRNYVNSRNHADIVGGYTSANGEISRGDGGFNIYGSAEAQGNVFENNISEGNGGGYYLNAYYQVIDGTRFLGNISLHDSQGFFINSGTTGTSFVTNTFAENVSIIEPRSIGALVSSAKATFFKNISLLKGNDSGLLIYKNSSSPGDGKYSFTGENLLSVSNVGTGINVTNEIPTWNISFSNSFLNSTNYSQVGSANYNKAASKDAGLETCRVWIPLTSSMRGAGLNGSDIGANILYRYENGKLTQTPLWHPETGQFPCGAVVAGVNDIAGSSCRDVHQRLNVNTNGCTFPQGYTGSPSPVLRPKAPKNLKIF